MEHNRRYVNDTPNDPALMTLTDVTSLVPTMMTFHKAVTLSIGWFFVLTLTMAGVKSFGWVSVKNAIFSTLLYYID